MTQQTAVEWLEEKFNAYDVSTGKAYFRKLIHQAKQIEKEQIINSCAYGITIYSSDESRFKFAEQYYNQTYNK